MGLLHGPGTIRGVIHPDLPPFERHVVLREEQLHHLHAFFQTIHPVAHRRERDAELPMLGFVPRRAHGALDTAARQVVHRHDLRREDGRDAVRHAGDERPQPDPRRLARESGEERPPLEARPFGIGVQRLEMVEHPDPVEPGVLGQVRARHDLIPLELVLRDIQIRTASGIDLQFLAGLSRRPSVRESMRHDSSRSGRAPPPFPRARPDRRGRTTGRLRRCAGRLAGPADRDRRDRGSSAERDLQHARGVPRKRGDRRADRRRPPGRGRRHRRRPGRDRVRAQLHDAAAASLTGRSDARSVPETRSSSRSSTTTRTFARGSWRPRTRAPRSAGWTSATTT